MTNRVLWLALLAGALSTPSALAHALGAECKAKGDRVEVEAYYSDGTEAKEAAVTVLDGDKRTIAEGRTDSQGRWSFARPAAGSYQVVIDAGAGHRKELRITVAEKTAAADSEGAACCCCEEGTPPRQVVSDGPTRAEFTRFPWLKAVMGCSILGMVGLGFWISRQRGRAGLGDTVPGEGTP
jgi:hypothetical protein